MRVKIGDEIYDSENTPIMLIFEDDNQRKEVIGHLSSMVDKEGVRKYGIFPSDMEPNDMMKFANIDIKPKEEDED